MRQILTVGVVIKKRLVNELKYALCLVTIMVTLETPGDAKKAINRNHYDIFKPQLNIDLTCKS